MPKWKILTMLVDAQEATEEDFQKQKLFYIGDAYDTLSNYYEVYSEKNPVKYYYKKEIK